MTKQLLIVKASSDICAAEVEHIRSIATMFDMKNCTVDITSIDDFRKKICPRRKYDYIYLAAHANTASFGTSDGIINIGWIDFAGVLCETDCLNRECILLLGCCRGGLKGVSELLFMSCDKIDYVCGPRWLANKHDITTGFHVFIYNMEIRNEQPSHAAKRASDATGYDFFCYDRVEFDDSFRSPP